MAKYLHISPLEKFIPEFIEFIRDYFDFEEHEFILLDRKNKKYLYKVPSYKNIYIISSKLYAPILALKMYKAKKIFLHGLWNPIVPFLYFQPWLYHKYYWIMWGGDFYFPERQSKLKRRLIQKIKHFIGFIEKDFDYVVRNYGARGKWYECVVYIRNIKFKETDIKYKNFKKNIVNIIIGNSATEENDHLEVFKSLKEIISKHENIKIYVPLSYGDQNYANKIVRIGKKMFGNQFVPLTEYMPLNLYIDFLTKMDIGIFNNQRQQALGNIITLLGHGKKVYIRRNTPHWHFLYDYLNVKVFDIDEGIHLEDMPIDIKTSNIKKIRNFFDEKNVISQWRRILNYDK